MAGTVSTQALTGIEEQVAALHARIGKLEAENAHLRGTKLPANQKNRRQILKQLGLAAVAVAAGHSVGAESVSASNGNSLILGSNANFAETETALIYDGGGAPVGDVFLVSDSYSSTTGSAAPSAISGRAITGKYGSGLYGYTQISGGYGVIGIAYSGATYTAGVYGAGDNSSSWGVYGTSASGIGVQGISSSGTAVQGHTSTGIGVYGINTGGGSFPYGVVGAVTVPGFALYGVANVQGSAGFAAGGQNGAFAGQFSGQTNFFGTIYLGGPGFAFVVGPGVTKNAAVQVADGSHRLLHCVEAPEPWFEDFGTGTLNAGKAEVKLETTFASTIDTSTLHVFLTPHDESQHLAVKATSGGGFSVAAGVSSEAAARGVKTTDLNGSFTYRVVGKRKDVNGERLAKFTPPNEIKLPTPPIPSAMPKNGPSKVSPQG